MKMLSRIKLLSLVLLLYLSLSLSAASSSSSSFLWQEATPKSQELSRRRLDTLRDLQALHRRARLESCPV
jgi:hypothetical protein